MTQQSEQSPQTEQSGQPEQSGQSELHSEAFWDQRYSSRTALWSGNPNPNLVAQATELAPGHALDVGCGEGADAVWLARRGWQVTAADLSGVALRRAAEHAAQAGAGIAERIAWLHADLTLTDPGKERFDLVSAQYLHLPPEPRAALFRCLAAATAPGGTLLVVAHHPSDLQTTVPRPNIPELFFTGDDIVPLLAPDAWEIEVNTAAPRPTTDPEGRTVTIHDTVLRARRRG